MIGALAATYSRRRERVVEVERDSLPRPSWQLPSLEGAYPRLVLAAQTRNRPCVCKSVLPFPHGEPRPARIRPGKPRPKVPAGIAPKRAWHGSQNTKILLVALESPPKKVRPFVPKSKFHRTGAAPTVLQLASIPPAQALPPMTLPWWKSSFAVTWMFPGRNGREPRTEPFFTSWQNGILPLPPQVVWVFCCPPCPLMHPEGREGPSSPPCRIFFRQELHM